MITNFPEFLNVGPDELGQGHSVQVRVLSDMASVAADMAATMLQSIESAAAAGKSATLIVPVGPVDQYPLLARAVNERRVSLRDVVLINMDEYLTDDDQWLPAEHPLSFRGYMDRQFYDLLDPELAPLPEHRVFPHPDDPDAIGRLIEQRGGVDVCFGGIGINGHMAFNEPPEPDETISDSEFANLPTRVLSLSRETRTINANTVGGSIDVVPRRCITVGMREILGSRAVRFYCNRPWQSAVVRRVLHGPPGAACPASLLRNHPDAVLTIADYVAARPDIRLR
ncbi:MAG: glucosamine-6-phosphate isomerase [Maioricimonas sp. JB045]|uniref:glucosamine-6-phosphate isomerase n=1 Tax=Maioricimonas sp. JC845 TaxID=3232138 RepID=UPI00345A7964